MQKAWLTIKFKKSEGGFSAVEVLLAATVFGFLVTALMGAVIYGRASTANAGDHQRATMLAEEGLEAARNISNAAYANLVDGTYGIAQSGGQWTFSGTSDTSGNYTRQVTVAAAGTNRKAVTSTVTWAQPQGGNTSVTLTTRLSNWEASIAVATSWANATVAGSLDQAGSAINGQDVVTIGNYSYTILASGSNNFYVANVSNPAAPSQVAALTLSGAPTNMVISGNYAYVTNTNDSAELQIVNISNPAAPTLAASVNMTGVGNGVGVFVSGNYAYVARANDTTTNAFELTIVNVTNPASPTVAGGYNNAINMNKVYVSGNYAYVATASTTQEMLVVNVTNPASPTLAATYNPTTPNSAGLAITGSGNTVYLGMSTTLDAINVTTPTSPTRLGTFTAAGIVQDISLDTANNLAFLGTAGATGEFQVVNVATPASMSLVKTLDVSGTSSALTGVSYNATLDIVAGASASDTQELILFKKN